MPDFMSKEARSRHMAKVKSRDTKLERDFAKILSRKVYPLGYRFRKNHKSVFGTPDMVFLKFRIAVFVDSDFWHGRNYDRMKTRMNEFWCSKIERNMERDKEVTSYLEKIGWRVLRFGEKQIKKEGEALAELVLEELNSRRG